MPRYSIKGRDLHNRGLSLATSAKSGHPIFPVGRRPRSNYQPPSCDTDDESPFGVEISPQGTWKPVKHGHPTANIEVLDLSDRYGYKALKETKMKPRNAIKKGLKPTKTSELPPKRTIYQISSDDNSDDSINDDRIVSDPSPLRAKRPRMTAASNPPQSRFSALDELRAAAGRQTSPVLTNNLPMKPHSYTKGLSAQGVFTRQPTYDQQPPANSSDSPTTVLGTHEEEQLAAVASRQNQGTAASTSNPAPPDVGSNSPFITNPGINGFHQSHTMKNPPLTTNYPPATSTLPTRTHPLPNPFTATTPSTNVLNTNQLPSTAFTNTNSNPPPSTTPIPATATLRIYLPPSSSSSSTTTRIYVPLKLTATPTLASLFAAVEAIVGKEVKMLVMRFDPPPPVAGGVCGDPQHGESDDPGKGILALMKGLGSSSWECFLDEVSLRDGGVGVGVEVVGMGL
ncbi:MAG: hypothetical protein LQ345_006845 [Seirophora villosa]|nr:MAG: hypothetical protein LQ345_006845 [Seirophora villosa]